MKTLKLVFIFIVIILSLVIPTLVAAQDRLMTKGIIAMIKPNFIELESQNTGAFIHDINMDDNLKTYLTNSGVNYIARLLPEISEKDSLMTVDTHGQARGT